MTDRREQSPRSNDGNGPSTDDKELASRRIDVEHKRFYVDVKENKRGRVIKISESVPTGAGQLHKNRVILSMTAASKLRDHLEEMKGFTKTSAPPSDASGDKDNNTLKTATIVSDPRRYYVDLRENARGRFVRIAQTHSDPRMARIQVAIPVDGLNDVYSALDELLNQYGEGFIHEEAISGALPESRKIQAGAQKQFFFDAGSNERGRFVRISEVRSVSRLRNAITVPENELERFRDTLNSLITEMKSTAINNNQDGATAAASSLNGHD